VLGAADAALHVLATLHKAASAYLKSCGWDIALTEENKAAFLAPKTDAPQFFPPSLDIPHHLVLKPTANALLGSQAPDWAFQSLLEVPALCAPYIRTVLPSSPAAVVGTVAKANSGALPAEGVLEWGVRVQHIEPGPSPNDEEALAVLDVRDGEGALSRHLVMGCWHGVGCAFRESEQDRDYPAGSHLESWYTVTLAGLAVLATRGKGRVLVVGLGGGSLPAFLARHGARFSTECCSAPLAF
jgi:hypothetical protein